MSGQVDIFRPNIKKEFGDALNLEESDQRNLGLLPNSSSDASLHLRGFKKVSEQFTTGENGERVIAQRNILEAESLTIISHKKKDDELRFSGHILFMVIFSLMLLGLFQIFFTIGLWKTLLLFLCLWLIIYYFAKKGW